MTTTPDLHIFRDKNGTAHVEAATFDDMYWGQGFVHARDRGVQMLMMRILGQGRLCETLNDNETSLGIDKFFRQMNWHNNLSREFDKLEPKYQSYLQSYADGVNAAFAEKTPWEYKLLGYNPEKWTPNDTILISRMVGYLTLAQSQAEMERLFVGRGLTGWRSPTSTGLTPAVPQVDHHQLLEHLLPARQVDGELGGVGEEPPDVGWLATPPSVLEAV